MYRINATKIKIPKKFFGGGTWQIDSEIYLEVQGVKKSQTLLKKKNKVRGLDLQISRVSLIEMM